MTRSSVSRRLAALVAFLALLGAPRAARANNSDIFGMGLRAQGMAGAQTAAVSDGSAAYSNPAALSLLDRARLSFAATYIDIDTEMDVQNSANRSAERAAEDVGDFLGITIAYGRAYALDFFEPEGAAAEEAPREAVAPTFYCPGCGGSVEASADQCPACGMRFAPVLPREPLRERGGPRLGWGISVFAPTTIVSIRAEREEAARFTEYDGRAERLGLYAALGIELRSWIAIGAGAAILADFETTVTTDISTDVNIPTEVAFAADLEVDAAPVLGVLLTPLPNLRFGLAYRGEMSLKVDAEVNTLFLGIPGVPTVLMEAITLFSPDQVALGVAWRPSERVELALDLTWYNWSRYPGPAPRIASQGGSLPLTGNIPEDPGYHDIFEPRLGVEWQAMDSLALRGGYAFRPGPAPFPDEEANLLDPSQHIVGIGAAWRVPVDAADILIEGALQVHWTPTISVDKTDPPGNFDASAIVILAGVGVTATF